MKPIVNFHCLTEDIRLFTLSQGLDATTVFQDIGHSAEALKILAKYYIGELREVRIHANTTYIILLGYAGADPGFFLGGGALVSCSTSTPIKHVVFFFLQNTSCIRKPQVISGGGGAHPLHPPPRSAPATLVLLSMQPQHSSTAHYTDNNITCITLQCTRPDYRNDAIASSTCSSFTTSLEDTYEHICRHSPGVTPSGKDNQIHPVGSDTLCQWNSCASFLCIH